MHVEGTDTFLWASGVEHHALYQYQFNGAQNIFAGIQTETPYYMPNPDARSQPFQRSDVYSDPDYTKACPPGAICDAFGLRVLNSRNVMIYGGGLYSFFKNYDVSCSSPDAANGYRNCQNQIFSIEGGSSVQWFALSQVGAEQMITIDGKDKAKWSDNLSVYSNTIGYFTYSA
jgi:glucan 1,3-beta-glucosidase